MFARRVDKGAFRLDDGLGLAGHKVLGFDMPRAHAPDVSLRRDLFGFWLEANPVSDLRAGASVTLTGDAAAAK